MMTHLPEDLERFVQAKVKSSHGSSLSIRPWHSTRPYDYSSGRRNPRRPASYKESTRA